MSMSFMTKNFVQQELRSMTSGQLRQFGMMHGYSFSDEEVDHILEAIKKPNVDPFRKEEFEKIFSSLAEAADQATATKARNLFRDVIRANGLQHLFNFNL